MIFLLIPKWLRDYAYSLVARSRYTIFGQKQVCDIGNKDKNPRLLT